MKTKQFEKEIKEILTTETPDVLSKIKQDRRFHVTVKEKVSIFNIFKQNRLSYVFSSIFVFVLVGFAILLTQTSPGTEVVASTITIDINPSVELLLNEDDEIIDINPINGDGEALIINHEHFKGMSIDTAIRNLIQNAINQGYIVDDSNAILINVESKDSQKKLMIQEKLETAFKRESMRHNKPLEIRSMIAQMTEDAKEQASQRNMSNAKYELIQTILDTTDDYSFEELKSASIKTLFSILNEINGNESNFPPMGPPSSMPGSGGGQ